MNHSLFVKITSISSTIQEISSLSTQWPNIKNIYPTLSNYKFYYAHITHTHTHKELAKIMLTLILYSILPILFMLKSTTHFQVDEQVAQWAIVLTTPVISGYVVWWRRVYIAKEFVISMTEYGLQYCLFLVKWVSGL